MGVRGWLIGGAIGTFCAMGLWSGCDKADASKKAIVLNPTTRQTVPVTPRATAPSRATTQPAAATQAAANQKPQSFMMINGVWVDFNEAKLVLKREDNRVYAFLSSNDGAEVLKPDYQGNRYFFEMALDALDDPKNMTLPEYRYKAATAEPVDSPNGIFIDGDRQHLQPYDIEVTFDRDGEKIVAQIRGQFLYFPKGQQQGQWIPVMATLSAKPVVK